MPSLVPERSMPERTVDAWVACAICTPELHPPVSPTVVPSLELAGIIEPGRVSDLGDIPERNLAASELEGFLAVFSAGQNRLG